MNAKVLPFLFALALALMLALLFSAWPTAALAAAGDDCDLDGGVDNGRIIVDGAGDEVCVPPAAADGLAKCRAAGWGVLVIRQELLGGFTVINCGVRVRDDAKHRAGAADADGEACSIYLSVGNPSVPACGDAFGPGLRFPENDGGDDQRFIYNCPAGMIPDPEYVSGGVQECVAWDNKKVCETVLAGDLQTAADGTTEICSGADAADTFCILGEESVFPCRGLLRHARQCNHAYNRPALNPFLCAPVCPTNKVAVGGACECGAGLTPDGDDCVPE